MSARKKFSAKVYRELLAKHNERCAGCKCSITALSGLEWDHIIELSKGGEDKAENLQPLCKVCHRIKTSAGATTLAKAKRANDKHIGTATDTKGPPIKSRGFPKRAKPEPKPLPPRQSLYKDVSNA